MEVQLGGVRESILDFLQKTKTFQATLLYIIFIVAIVFKNQIPPAIYDQADSFLGRSLAVFLVAVITTQFGWVLGLLAAMSVALLLGLPKQGGFPLTAPVKEGFGSGGETAIQVVSTGKKWFVEKVLKENPVAIEEEKVITLPVQNDSPSGVGGGVQNSSVT